MGKHERHSKNWSQIEQRVAQREQARVDGLTVAEAEQLEQALKDNEDFPPMSGELNG